MAKILKRLAAFALLGTVAVSTVGCAFGDLAMPEWFEQATCDHVYDEEKVLLEATCTQDGKVEKICSECGKTKIVVQRAGHTPAPIQEEVPATCEVAGVSAGKYCTVCEEVLEEPQEFPALGHTYENGECIRCSAQGVNPADCAHTDIGENGDCITCGEFNLFTAETVGTNEGDSFSGWYRIAGESDNEYASYMVDLMVSVEVDGEARMFSTCFAATAVPSSLNFDLFSGSLSFSFSIPVNSVGEYYYLSEQYVIDISLDDYDSNEPTKTFEDVFVSGIYISSIRAELLNSFSRLLEKVVLL